MGNEGLYEALGLSTGAEDVTEPTETQEIAEPDNAEETEGGTEQEVAEPAEGADGAKKGKGRQSAAENQKFARQRRQREMEEAIANARAEEQQRITRVLQNAGLIDPANRNGKITSLEQLEERAKSNAAKEAAKALSENKELTKEQLVALMQSTESGREMLRTSAEAQTEKLGVYRQQQLALISKLDPSIKTFDDLQQMPEYEAFEGYVRDNGLSWQDAFRLAAGNRIAQMGAAAARQQTLNNIGGKTHMTQDGARGGEGTDVPKDVEAMYREMDPSLTHEQCVKKFHDYLKRTKKG